MKKLPSQISNEDLLNAINDGKVNEKPTEHTVLRFIADFGIEPGTKEVNGRTLYKLYKYHNIDVSVSAIEFNLIFTSYFLYVDNTNGRKFSLNVGSANLTRRLAEFLVKRRESKTTKSQFFRHHFESFIQAHGLKQGTKNLPAQALFYFYDKWQYENKLKTRLPYREFIAMIRLYFNTKRTTKTWCVVKLNKSFLDSHKNDLQTALEWGNKFNAKKTTKEKKK